MNVISNEAKTSNPMSPDFELNISAPMPVEKARGKRASNDASEEAPILAADAMAICMANSAFGG
jgi:hypothetical protein